MICKVPYIHIAAHTTDYMLWITLTLTPLCSELIIGDYIVPRMFRILNQASC